MKTLVSVAVLTALILLTHTCTRTTRDARPEGLSEWLQPLPQPPAQPIAQVELGRVLFYESRLSRSGLVSCNSCHSMSGFGVDHRARSIGENATEGLRNTPTVFNTVFLERDGYSLVEISKQQILSVPDMNLTAAEAVERLTAAGYAPLFRSAFPDDSLITFDNIALALAAFQRTLVTPDSRYDQYLRGIPAALNERELRGLGLFQRNGCVGCHNGPMLGGSVYSKFTHLQKKGLSTDFGEFIESGVPDDQFVFRAAPLRNVAVTYPYFHNGSVVELDQALRIMGSAQLGYTLSDNDVADLTAFLRTLTGTFPKTDRPIPPGL